MASRAVELRLAAFEKELPSWSNDELYKFYLYEAQIPDSYDGEFTDDGHGQLGLTEAELTRRLQASGFLTSDWEDTERMPE